MLYLFKAEMGGFAHIFFHYPFRERVFRVFIGITGEKIKCRNKSMDEAVEAGRIMDAAALKA